MQAQRQWVVSATLQVLNPCNSPSTHCTGKLGGSQIQAGQVWRRENLLAPLESEPLTVQPVVSCYTD